MPRVTNKRFLLTNLPFGKEHEEKIYPLIKNVFNNKLEKADDQYSNFDYLSDDMVVELKTRRGDYLQKQYATFPFDAVKFDKWRELKNNNPNLEGYICWLWVDMGRLHYWKIHENSPESNEIDHFPSRWEVDGKEKEVIEVFREDTEMISLKK